MRIAAALSFYDEAPSALVRLVLSLEGVVDRLYALDGPWRLYDDRSSRLASSATLEALRSAAEHAGVELPAVASGIWETQPEKRDWLMQWAARDFADGWLLVIDADEYVVESHREDLAALLRETPADVAYVSGQQRGWRGAFVRWRRLYRAAPDLRVYAAHNEYVRGLGTDAARRLAGDPRLPLEVAADASSLLVIGHDDLHRGEERRKRARRYYVRRSASEER